MKSIQIRKLNCESVIILPVLSKSLPIKLVFAFSALLLMAGCKAKPGLEGAPSQVETQLPTPTEAPMAARVNGKGILLSDYEAELNRFQTGMTELGAEYVPSDAARLVLDEMTNQVLLAQAAKALGFSADEAAVQARLSELAAEAGGEENLDAWISSNFYTEESFRRALVLDMAVVWMRNKIVSETPQVADQVRAHQILVTNENEAIAVERQLQVGKDFETLAFEYDPLTGGDLSWFPAGYLLQPDVEKAAFSLQPGQYSGIIPTAYGFHIVYVVERDNQHPLSPEALLFMQHQALDKWLAERRAQSAIEILVP